jgi:Protein of unknown function (DUF3177)
MSQELLRSLVWMDYRLAVLFTVGVPLVLLVWSTYRQDAAMQRLLIIYWRVASLLMITVYLMVGGMPLGFLTGPLAQILIPIGLWFWVDLNEEIEDQPANALKLTFNIWRWATTMYCVLGVLASLPFLQCAFSKESFSTPFCKVWIEAPLLYRQNFEFLHQVFENKTLGILAIAALVIYVCYFSYFVLVRLGKQGRSAVLD